MAEVSALLEKSAMVFSLPSSHITANQVVALRKGLPDGCTAKVVKNKLMRIACKGTEFEELANITIGENFWMFVEGEDNLAEPIKYVAEFAKQFDKAAVSSSSSSAAAVIPVEVESKRRRRTCAFTDVKGLFGSTAVADGSGGGGGGVWRSTPATRTKPRVYKKQWVMVAVGGCG